MIESKVKNVQIWVKKEAQRSKGSPESFSEPKVKSASPGLL